MTAADARAAARSTALGRTPVGSFVRWGTRHGIARVFLTLAARRGELQASIVMDPEVRKNPYPHYDAVRELGPLARGRIAYLSADHQVCGDVLRSADFGTAVGERGLPKAFRRALEYTRDDLSIGPIDAPALLAVDPPVHTRYRRLVSKVFTPRAIESLRPQVEQVADELLDALEGLPSADLVASYASLLPVTVISQVLAVPVDMRKQFLEWGSAAAPTLDLGLGFGQHRKAESAVRALNSWMYGHFDRLRENPGEDILSRLVTLESDGDRLDGRELAATAGLLLAAGFETTVNLVGNGAVLLMENPEQLAALREDPSLWANAVEEVLRYESPVQNTGRRAIRPTTMAGRELSPADLVVVFLGGANRDPKVFPDPHVFDVRRPNAREHLSFSAGVHYCVGAALARMEGEIALRKLFERYPDVSLIGEPHRRPTRTLRGYDAVPVSLGTRRRQPVG